MTRERVLTMVGAVLIVSAFVALLVGVVVWQQPGEVKALTVAVVLGVAAFAALVST